MCPLLLRRLANNQIRVNPLLNCTHFQKGSHITRVGAHKSVCVMSGAPYFLHIYAKPNSKENKIEEWRQERDKNLLEVRVQSPPDKGKANKQIIELLAQTLGISKSNIELVQGATQRTKTFKIEPWSPQLALKLPPDNQ